MNTLRFFSLLAVSIFLVLPVTAQQEQPVDTVVVKKKRVIRMSDDDGNHRVMIHAGGGSEEDVDIIHFDADGHDFSFHPDMFGVMADDPAAMKHLAGLHDMMGSKHFVFGDGEYSKELYEMEAEAKRMALSVRTAESDERSELEQELQEKLREIFDHKQELREEKINRLREMLQDATTERDEREDNRQEIVRRRMQELLGESKYAW